MRRLAFLLSYFIFPLSPAALPNEPYTQRPLLQATEDAPAQQRRHITQDQLDNLTSLAALEDVAYCVPAPGISKPFSCPSRCAQFPDLELVNTWNTGLLLTDSSGFLALDHAQRRIVVAFRGTYSLGDVIADLSTNPQHYVPYIRAEDGERCDNCMVHAGFLSSWLNTAPTVNQLLKDVQQEYPGFTLDVLGHSLGGALALLASLDFVAHGHSNLRVTTFGQPKVGNQALAAYVDRVLVNEGKMARVTRKSDPVPLLPLTEWDYYPHAGELFINKDSLDLSPEDVLVCVGNTDLECSAALDHSLYPDPKLESTPHLEQQHKGSSTSERNKVQWHAQKQKTSNPQSTTSNATMLDILTNPFTDLSHIPNLPPPHSEMSKRSVFTKDSAPSRPVADAQLESRFATESFDIAHAVQAASSIPARYKLWELFFAHRDYFVRLGLCVKAPSLGLPDLDIPGFGGGKSPWEWLRGAFVGARQQYL